MNTFKNYLIALLTGLLVLTFSIQTSHGASSVSTSAKAIQYDHCLTMDSARFNDSFSYFSNTLDDCAKLKP